MARKPTTMEETQKIRTFFIATFGVSLFFWAWAVKNTFGMNAGNFDLGVISFGTVMLSSTYVLRFLASNGFGSATKLVKNVTTCTHIFVAINYLLGSYIGFAVLGRPGFGVYCVVFAGLWLGIAYYGLMLMTSASSAGSFLTESLPLSA